MTKILIHGAPETDAIWATFRHELAALGHEDVVCLSPPGFGKPVPDGFGATISDYRDWLVAELSRFDEPVDLVGHDWGGGHVVGVAMRRPDLLRSWVSDAVGIFEPDYVWHPHARTWVTAEGAQHAADLIDCDADEREARIIAAGVIDKVARILAPGINAEMMRAMIALYRSSQQPVMSELGRELTSAAARPGLVVVASRDEDVGTVASRHRAADRAGAKVATFEDLGHWWMVEDPRQSAQAVADFWGTLQALQR